MLNRTRTRSFVTLAISGPAYAEIREKLVAAGYHHVLKNQDDGSECIDMDGIAVAPEHQAKVEKET